jgi:hypothetical protein
MYRHRRWLERPGGRADLREVDAERSPRIIEQAARRRRAEALRDRVDGGALRLRDPVAPFRDGAPTEDEAVAAAEAMGYPVVLKVIAEEVVHKSDVGGVRSGSSRRRSCARRLRRDAAPEVPQRAGSRPRSKASWSRRWSAGGKETIVGLTADPGFGRLLMFGLGGIYVEALRDVVFRIHPVTDLDAREMVAPSAAPAAGGDPGRAAGGPEAIADVILRISQLVGLRLHFRPPLVRCEVSTDRFGIHAGAGGEPRKHLDVADVQSGAEVRLEEPLRHRVLHLAAVLPLRQAQQAVGRERVHRQRRVEVHLDPLARAPRRPRAPPSAPPTRRTFAPGGSAAAPPSPARRVELVRPEHDVHRIGARMRRERPLEAPFAGVAPGARHVAVDLHLHRLLRRSLRRARRARRMARLARRPASGGPPAHALERSFPPSRLCEVWSYAESAAAFSPVAAEKIPFRHSAGAMPCAGRHPRAACAAVADVHLHSIRHDAGWFASGQRAHLSRPVVVRPRGAARATCGQRSHVGPRALDRLCRRG